MSVGIAGSAIHDAHIAACDRAAGAEELVTWNRRDFERLELGELTLVTPR